MKNIGLYIIGFQHSDFLEVGTKIEIQNRSLPGEGETYRFCLDIGRIIGNFHFSIVLMGTFWVNISS